MVKHNKFTISTDDNSAIITHYLQNVNTKYATPFEKDALKLLYSNDVVKQNVVEEGGKCVFSSEWNAYAQKTYLANFGEVPFGDITKKETKSYIPKEFDILCAGFPCQPFSIAGVSKKKSLGRETGFQDKTQGTLFFDVADIINRHRPKAFYLENVKNLTSHDKGNTFKIIRETLEELDYSIHYQRYIHNLRPRKHSSHK